MHIEREKNPVFLNAETQKRNLIEKFLLLRYWRFLICIFLALFCLYEIIICICTYKTHDVALFIVDSFDKKESHGSTVEKIAKKWSFSTCQILEEDVSLDGKIHMVKYLRALEKIRDYSKKNPGKKIVVNFSLGARKKNPVEEKLIREMKDIFLVCSAGNDGDDTKVYPAAYKDTIAVASVYFDGQKRFHSNYGSHVNLAVEEENFVKFKSGVYIRKTGTSFSSPKVSGLIAHALSQSNWNRKELLQHLENSCEKLEKDSKDNFYPLGWGQLNSHQFLLATSRYYQVHTILYRISILIFIGNILILWAGLHHDCKFYCFIGSLFLIYVQSLSPQAFCHFSTDLILCFISSIGLASLAVKIFPANEERIDNLLKNHFYDEVL